MSFDRRALRIHDKSRDARPNGNNSGSSCSKRRMRISFAALLAIPVAVVASPSAASEERGFYIGGALGQATFADWCVPSPLVLSCDEAPGLEDLWRLPLQPLLWCGSNLPRLGQVSGTVSGVGTVTADQTSFGSPQWAGSSSPQFSVFGKAGLLMTEQETPASRRASATRPSSITALECATFSPPTGLRAPSGSAPINSRSSCSPSAWSSASSRS